MNTVILTEIEEDFLNQSVDNSASIAYHRRMTTKLVDTDKILRKAEHEISYSAKRAIEMYCPVWEKEPVMYLFDKCAEHFGLGAGETTKCKKLMEEMGMGDLK